LFLSLYDRTLGIPDPRFFDGAIFGWVDLSETLVNEFKDKGSRGIEACSQSLRSIKGSMIYAPDQESPEGRGYNYAGARELSYEEKKRRLTMGSIRTTNIRDGGSTEIAPLILDPFADRLVEVRSILVDASGKAKNLVHDLMYFRHDRHRWCPCN